MPCPHPPQSGPPCCLRHRPPRPTLPPAGPHAVLPPMVPLTTRQESSAFNQPLSLDTSRVKRMGWMFDVRSARALPSSACTVGAFRGVPAACATDHPTPPSRLLARMSPLLLCSPLFPRQDARAFNQPLSLDTSSVTDMRSMFMVRSARALPAPSTVGATLLLAPPTTPPHPPACLPACRASSYASPFYSTGRVGVQPAAEPRHVPRHSHAVDVSGALRACPALSLDSWAFPARGLHRHRFHMPSCLPARVSPLPPCLPFYSAGHRRAVRREQDPHHLCMVGQC